MTKVIYKYELDITDRQTLMLTHLSQLLNYITGFGGLIVPLVLWTTNRDKIYQMNEQGKSIINFQLSMMIYAFICVPLIFLLGLGILGLIAVGIVSLIFPIINAVKVNNGETPNYPMTIEFLK
jgi:uncharacterized Tic20 family protein